MNDNLTNSELDELQQVLLDAIAEPYNGHLEICIKMARHSIELEQEILKITRINIDVLDQANKYLSHEDRNIRLFAHITTALLYKS